MMVDVDIVADESVYGKHWWPDNEAAPLIPAVYLLKTVHKKETQRCHSHTKCSCSVLFKVRGRSNVKDQISALKIWSCIDFV